MKKVVGILGAGESGVGAALLAQAKGYNVFVSDFGTIQPKYAVELERAEISYEEKSHDKVQKMQLDVVVKSPGIPETAAIVKHFVTQGVPVVSEIQFAADHTQSYLIGITGTNGKTTTTLLIGKILQDAGLSTGIVGNVGTSFARQILEDPKEYYVLELSSFQLDSSPELKLNIAVLLNITPDHLDRYESLQAYVQSKFNIGRNQQPQDFFIYSEDDPIISKNFKNKLGEAQQIGFTLNNTPGINRAWQEDNLIKLQLKQPKQQFYMDINQLTIGGKHNTYNTMAASIVANVLMIRKERIRESLTDFRNVEHRLEYVAKVKGVDYVNDSKATNVNAAWYALESMDKPVIWIAGGQDKGNDYEILKPIVKEKVKVLVCMGTNNIKLHQAFAKDVEMIINTGSAKEAVNAAYSLANNGEVVLLSPACASFDLFEDYEDRGRQFKEAVRSL